MLDERYDYGDDRADPGPANAPSPARDATTDRDAEEEDDDSPEVTFSYYPWWTDGEPEVEYADPGNVPDPGNDDDHYPDPAQDASREAAAGPSRAGHTARATTPTLKCRSGPTLTPLRCSIRYDDVDVDMADAPLLLDGDVPLLGPIVGAVGPLLPRAV